MKVWLVLVLVLAGAMVLAACAGHDWASPVDLARALAGDGDLRSRLLFEWRMPRVLAAALVGVLLGLGGAVFQGVFRNPLAEPYLLGSAGGAGAGCDRRAPGPARNTAIAAAAGAGIRRCLGRDCPGHRCLARRRRCRCCRHIACGRGHRRGARSAALVLHAGVVGRDREPADRAELGARRRADSDLAGARPVGAAVGRVPRPHAVVRARARRHRAGRRRWRSRSVST